MGLFSSSKKVKETEEQNDERILKTMLDGTFDLKNADRFYLFNNLNEYNHTFNNMNDNVILINKINGVTKINDKLLVPYRYQTKFKIDISDINLKLKNIKMFEQLAFLNFENEIIKNLNGEKNKLIIIGNFDLTEVIVDQISLRKEGKIEICVNVLLGYFVLDKNNINYSDLF